MMTIHEFAQNREWPAFRLKQVQKARESELVSSWSEISTLSKEDRAKLEEDVPFYQVSPLKKTISADKTAIKWLHQVQGNAIIETVLLIHTKGEKTWGTVCVSSQAGCPLNCGFCATGAMGFMRNLETEEIVDQYLIAKKEARARGIEHPNIVLMGMGEPTLNLDNLIPAIKIWTDPERFGLSTRKITLSTSGLVPGIRRLLKEKILVRLAISFHAPTDQLREKIMPINKSFPIKKLMESLDEWTDATNKQIFYEYLLIKDFNDKPEHAKELAQLLKSRLAKVNLIPYNPTDHQPSWERSPIEHIRAFKEILENAGIPTTIRHTKGDEIQAACGQLTIKNLTLTRASSGL